MKGAGEWFDRGQYFLKNDICLSVSLYDIEIGISGWGSLSKELTSYVLLSIMSLSTLTVACIPCRFLASCAISE